MEKKRIHIESLINAPIESVWESYNNPDDIVQWNQASEDWHCPSSINDLKVGGKFKNKMAAKDGSFEFDFEGTYTEITPYNSISYLLGDNRETDIKFKDENGKTRVIIDFDAEETNPLEMQKEGWQAILDSFKNHTEKKHN